MPAALLPDPPATADGSLFGAPLGRTRRVTDALSEEHAEAAREQMQGELLERYDSAGGAPEQRAGRGHAEFGPAPTWQVRRVYVAKFNPAESDPGVGRFDASDPYAESALWDFTGPPSNWVGDWGTRTTIEHSTIASGDLVFVQCSVPRTETIGVDPADPFGGRRMLLGVWWVTHVHRRWLPWPAHRPVTEAWHAPLVRFNDPVDVRTIRGHSELADLGPFTDQRRAGLVVTTPAEAAALAAACSLPSWVLTDPDPVDIARRLATLHTGMREEDLRYRRDARARYQHIHAIETAASQRVRDQLADAGWSVMSREHRPRWGADLAAVREWDGIKERRAVEVKGKHGSRWSDVVLQQSQWERACWSAAAGDDEWWLAVCAKALDAAPLPVRQLPAPWVQQHWPADRIRAAGGWAGPDPDDFS